METLIITSRFLRRVIMIINHDKERLYNAIIYFVSNTQKCNKTKLMKLLYFLDFMHFEATGASVTGLKYSAWPFGPFPEKLGLKFENLIELNQYVAIYKIEDEKNITIKPKKKFDDTHFSKRQLKLLENISFMFSEATAKDMVEITHLPNLPWETTLKNKGEKAPIDYFLAVKSQELIEEYQENISDGQVIINALS